MKRLMLPTILYLAALVASSAHATSSDSAGLDYRTLQRTTWVLYPPSAPGVVAYSLIEFKQGENGNQGVMYSNILSGPQTPIRNIIIDGAEISFETVSSSYPDNATQWRGHFLNRNEMKITAIWNDGYPTDTEWVARLSDRREVESIMRMVPKSLITRKLPLPSTTVNVPSNGLASTPIMGWNSWNAFAERIDEKTIRQIADALVSTGLRDAGYIYVNIDAGWQGYRDKRGILHPNEKFPKMETLSAYLHSRGLKLGIYSSPGYVSCGGYVGSHGYETQDAETFASWQVDLLKYDWCSADDLYKTKEEMRAVYAKMGIALRATRRPVVYSLCQYGLFDVGKWAREVGGNLWRISSDSIVGNRWNSVSDRFDNNGDPTDSGPGGWNDPDILLIGNGGLTLDESRTHMTLWAMLGAPLLLGADIRNIAPELLSLLSNRDVIAVDQDSLGYQGRRIVQSSEVEVWLKRLSDDSRAVAIFNRGGTPQDIGLFWEALGLARPSQVRDLWSQTAIEAGPGGYHARVPAHGSIMLRLFP